MKPMLIIPPAPARWPALEDLLGHKGAPWVEDIQQRVARGVPGAQDVFAVMPAGAQVLANVTINKWGDCGVLGHCYTRPEQRRRGHARRLLETALAWFDMTGGRHLYLGTTADLVETLYGKFGFAPLHRAAGEPQERVTMYRPGRGVAGALDFSGAGPLAIGEVTRAAWPALVQLLQYRPGPDPRVPVAESAVGAEVFGLELLATQERGACVVQGAYRDGHLVGVGSLATDRPGERTFAVLFPHGEPHVELRASLLEVARARGYGHVDFPMEALAGLPAAVAEPAAVAAESSEPPPVC
jgi:GNAT superfamily N-acetyltransferase